jgi:hypothetical protein
MKKSEGVGEGEYGDEVWCGGDDGKVVVFGLFCFPVLEQRLPLSDEA